MSDYLVSYDLSDDKYYNDLQLVFEDYISLNILKSVYIMLIIISLQKTNHIHFIFRLNDC